MKNIEVSIQIRIKQSDLSVDSEKVPTKVDDGHFHLVLSEGDLFDIDTLEDGLLHATYPAMRDALTQALETATKQKAVADCKCRGAGYKVVRHKSDYQVDGEVGRFQFGLFDVVGPGGKNRIGGQ